VNLLIKFPTGESVEAGVNIRPYAKEVLKAANENYEVVVFTASHQCYADVVLDYLDPDHSLIHHRFYRDSCVVIQGVYIKDLRIFTNWDLKDILIIDNAAYSFGY
jgi:CTD small phosphatase-like protein 2